LYTEVMECLWARVLCCIITHRLDMHYSHAMTPEVSGALCCWIRYYCTAV